LTAIQQGMVDDPTGLNESPSRATEAYWHCRVPAHWEVPSNFSLFQERIDRGGDESEMLTVTIDRGILRQSDFLEGSSKKDSSNEDKSNYKRVKVGDLAYNKMRMWQGAVGFSAYEGIVSPAYIVLEPRREINSRYYHYLFRTPLYTHLSAQHSHGICDDQNSLRFEDFKRIFSPFPPRPEQDAIVAYLDGKLKVIDQYLRVKEREIALLEERKRALIHRAVTRGLDDNPKLKPSGIPWLPEIPMEWEAVKLSYLARVTNGSTPSRSRPDYWSDGSVPWLSSGKVNDWIVESESELITQKALLECPVELIPKGSLLIGLIGQGKTRGMSAYLEIDACINQNVAAIIPKSKIDSFFLLYCLTAAYTEIRELGRGGNHEAMNCEIVSSFRIQTPPLERQKRIVSFLKSETNQIATTITRARRQIERMQEYRTALISEAVTGKLDVTTAG